MTKKRDYHVVPKGKEWMVKKENAQRASSTHNTQSDAVDAGKKLAKANKTELVIHRKDGTIRDSDSYGNDPHPPHDKKH